MQSEIAYPRVTRRQLLVRFALATVAPPGQQVARSGATLGAFHALGFLVIPFVPETQGVQLSDEVGAIPAAGT